MKPTPSDQVSEKSRPRTCPVCSSLKWAPCPECKGVEVGARVRLWRGPAKNALPRQSGKVVSFEGTRDASAVVLWDGELGLGAKPELGTHRLSDLEMAPAYHPEYCPCQGLRMACPDCHSERELDEFKRADGWAAPPDVHPCGTRYAGASVRESDAYDAEHGAPPGQRRIKVGDWVRLKTQPDQDGIVTEIRESGAIVVFELVQRKASRPFDAVALQAWSFMVEHVPSKPEPVVYPHGMGPSVVVNAYPGEPDKEPAPALSPKARRIKQLEGEIATGVLELLIVGQRPPTVETLREVTAQAKVVVRANAMFALTKLLPEGLFA